MKCEPVSKVDRSAASASEVEPASVELAVRRTEGEMKSVKERMVPDVTRAIEGPRATAMSVGDDMVGWASEEGRR
jgi:hypothetical protein